MDAPTWMAMLVAVAILSCLAYAARISIQYAQADVQGPKEAAPYSQRVIEAIERAEADMGGTPADSR